MMQFTEERSLQKSPKETLCLVGQDMHILNPLFFRAIEEQNSHAVAAMARRQVAAGATALDLNLGPAKKNKKLLAWTLAVVREVVDVPLFVASQIVSMPELLQEHHGKITINSVTADARTLTAVMEEAGAYGAGLVVLLTKPGQSVSTAEERLLLAEEVLTTAQRSNFPQTQLYLDPLLRPTPQGLPELNHVLETLTALPLVCQEKVHTIAALSTASAFLPAAKRAALHHRLLPLLVDAGLDTVILNCNDRNVMEVCQRIAAYPEEFSAAAVA